MKFILNENMELIIYSLKVLFRVIGTFYVLNKILKLKINKVIDILSMLTITIVTVNIDRIYGTFISTIITILLLSIYLKEGSKYNIIDSIKISMFAYIINYILFFCATFIISIVYASLGMYDKNYATLFPIICLYLFLVYKFANIKKFKNGFSFLNTNNKDLDTIILAISFIILSSYIIFFYVDKTGVKGLGWGIIALIVVTFIIIYKSFKIYYKQKLKDNKFKETEEELKNKTKEIESLNEEYNDTRKKMHTLSHKQETLEYKINQLENMNLEVAEEIDIKNKLSEITESLNDNVVNVDFIKTEIQEVDDVLDYMLSKCENENIKFDVQTNGNLYYMVNNLISKEDFATLLSDHIKDAIIAIKHSDNINKSILVRLGIFDDNYSIEILDSGVEFTKEVLQNLGKKPITTYKDEGGSGMGFMNTFDTLKKCKASLIIKEIGKPCKENFTKKIIIKFDGKNEFNIISIENKIVTI